MRLSRLSVEPLGGRATAMIEAPEVSFTTWAPWAERHRLRQVDGPWLGVYLWARFDEAPETTPPYPSLPEAVIYVGETKHVDRRPLREEHHRLEHYRATFPDDPTLAHLYVSVCRVKRFESGYASAEAITVYPILRVFTQYVEAKLYWEYTQRWGHPPALHYKKKREGE